MSTEPSDNSNVVSTTASTTMNAQRKAETPAVPAETEAAPPPNENNVKAESRDRAAGAGLKRIVTRIKNYPHRYTDDYGAHWIRDYYDISPERTLDFFKRLEKEGFQINLTQEEEELLEKVRKKASPLAMLPQARIVDGATKLLTRRNLLRKGAWIVGAITLDRMKNRYGDETKKLTEITKDMQAVDNALEQDDLTHEEREELKAKKHQIEEKMLEGPLGKFLGIIKNNTSLLAALAIIGYTSMHQGKDVVNHANQKVDKTIDFISSFIEYRLGYTISSPSGNRGI